MTFLLFTSYCHVSAVVHHSRTFVYISLFFWFHLVKVIALNFIVSDLHLPVTCSVVLLFTDRFNCCCVYIDRMKWRFLSKDLSRY